MSLLAEEVVEEWLNRKGYFTIRGIKLGVHEIDLLAVNKDGDCRHVEVQVSVNPVSYLTPVPKELRKKTGRSATSSKQRTEGELSEGVREWVEKKFLMDKKQQLRRSLHPGKWNFYLVIHKLLHPEEIPLIEARGIRVIRLSEILADLKENGCYTAAGGNLIELIHFEEQNEASSKK